MKVKQSQIEKWSIVKESQTAEMLECRAKKNSNV